jgi:plastocyanin
MSRPERSRSLRRLAALAAVLALAAALGAGAAGAVGPKKVQVGDNFFKPTKVTVTAGDTVTWTWVGSNTHNVKVTSGPEKFKSVNQSSGTFTRTLTKPGTYKIVCTFHPGMTMTLKVKKAPPTASTTPPTS